MRGSHLNTHVIDDGTETTYDDFFFVLEQFIYKIAWKIDKESSWKGDGIALLSADAKKKLNNADKTKVVRIMVEEILIR